FPPGQPLADMSVAAVPADTGRNEIPNARQTVESLIIGSRGHAEPGYFDHAAREKRGLGIVAESQPIADTGRDSDDVLERSCQFYSNCITIGVHAETFGGESLLNPVRQARIIARRRDGGRHAAAYFFGMAWTR